MPQLTRLSLFASDREAGQPISRLPFYAEIGLTDNLDAPVLIDRRFQDFIVGALEHVDGACAASASCRAAVLATLTEVLSRLLAGIVRDKLVQDVHAAQTLVARVLVVARDGAGGSLGGLDHAALTKRLDAALRVAAAEQHIQLLDPANDVRPITWAYPLGVLATDHAGYLSFDLTRIPPAILAAVAVDVEQRKSDQAAPLKTAVRLYPLFAGVPPLDALAQGRFTENAILVRANLNDPGLPPLIRNLGILAMQNPDLVDWRLSPASFAVNSGTLVGQDGCESLLPANVAVQEFYYYQVVRLNHLNSVQQTIPAGLRPSVRVGVIHEYRVAWYPLGHSLGQILYSLPLAPGESVNLAVVDWTRRDDAQRTEHTTLDEQLVHNEHRDRTITETVNAAIQEQQKGSSFMAGLAHSAGVVAALGAGATLAAGLAASLGGSSADSSGSRNVAANTVQNISDNIKQASAAMRELQSTVVVHSVQAEKEAIETRTVVNYNHSHALTILYYEVLRHFRVVTERTRGAAALLVDYKTQLLPFLIVVDQNIGGVHVHYQTYTPNFKDNRELLKAALLDQKFAAGFDAFDRLDQHNKAASHTPASPPPGSPIFRFFNFDLKTGGIFADRGRFNDARIDVRATLLPKEIQLDRGAPGAAQDPLNTPGSFTQPSTNNSFTGWLPPDVGTVSWSDIDSIRFNLDMNHAAASFQHIKVTGVDINGVEFVLIDKDYNTEPFLGHLILLDVGNFLLPVHRAPLPPPAPGPSIDVINDQTLLDELLEHLEKHKEYYNRIIWLSEDPLARATRFDGMAWDASSSLLDHVENRAVEIVGSWVAFPTPDQAINDAIQSLDAPALRNLELPEAILDERLVTLPARGVFAEAKLGHCNASEEIDNTRFWDWQTSPIPHLAPEIAPVTPVTPQPQQPNVQPTPFPQSLVNIVNPPAEPDPTGLAAALNVLATPNIFRDMSGQAQVADLLKKLSDNTISIADAANQARAIQAKGSPAVSGGIGAGGLGATGVGGSGSLGPRALPTQPSAAVRDMQDVQNVVDRAQRMGLMTPQAAQQINTQASRQLTGTAQTPDALDTGILGQGEFTSFASAGRLNARVSELLSSFMTAPLDSWRYGIGRFVLSQLSSNQLIGVVGDTEARNIRARYLDVAADPQPDGTSAASLFDNNLVLGPALAITFNFATKTGGRAAYILVGQSTLNGTAKIGNYSITLLETLVHELTHVRNQDNQQLLLRTPDSSSITYLDPALAAARTAANPPLTATVRVLRRFVEEVTARHVHWRVRNELRGKAGVLVLQPEQLVMAVFEFFVQLPTLFSLNNGYIEAINTRGDADRLRQIGMWLYLCLSYEFSDLPAQDDDAVKLFRAAAAWAQAEAAKPTPLADTVQAEGIAPLLREVL